VWNHQPWKKYKKEGERIAPETGSEKVGSQSRTSTPSPQRTHTTGKKGDIIYLLWEPEGRSLLERVKVSVGKGERKDYPVSEEQKSGT